MTRALESDTSLEPPVTAGAIRHNATVVLSEVASQADECERTGRLTPGLAKVFREAGLFEMGFPRRRGGLEMTLQDQVLVVARFARIDASVAWNVAIFNATGYYAGRLGDEAYAELYPTRDMPTSGAFHPKGRADRVEGGYMVSGNWDWGSGSYTAEHVIGGALAFDNGEPIIAPSGSQLVLGLWLPREAIRHADNWSTLGVRGSGSSSYRIDEPVFVPERYSFDREALANPDNDPLNKHVTLPFFPLTGVCVGLAQHAVDLARQAVVRRARGTGGTVDPLTRRLLGQVVTEVDTMFAAIRDIARRTDEVIFSPGRVLTPTEEQRLTVTNVTAGETLRRVLDLCLELYGSRYIFDDNPMQRVIRDATSALAHAGTKRAHWAHLGGLVASDHDGPATVFEEVEMTETGLGVR